MCLQPILPHSHFDLDGDFHRQGGLHRSLRSRASRCLVRSCRMSKTISSCTVSSILVLKSPAAQRLMDFDHRQFQHVGGGALNRAVHRQSFGRIGDGAAA